jgi:hypothetical protein
MWHAFTTTECADLVVSYCGLAPAWGNVFGFLSTDCPADSLVFFTTFNTTDCGDGNYTYFFDQLAAGTYLLPVVLDPGNGSVGPYTVEVTANSCLGTGVGEQSSNALLAYPDRPRPDRRMGDHQAPSSCAMPPEASWRTGP